MGDTASLAIVTCVRDEEAVLPAFLAYHRALGVERVYAYPDRCRDRTVDILQAQDWVEVVDRARSPEQRSHDVYQMACADDALGRARRDGFDWLLHIDADELAWGDNLPLEGNDPLVAGSLTTMLRRVQPETVSVRFRVLEAVIVDPPAVPFWTNELMQDKVWVPRSILDPASGRPEPLTKPIGHRAGKAAARLTADLQAASSHRWTVAQHKTVPDLISVPEEQLGWHYHYVVRDFESWLAKYRNFAENANRNARGPVLFPKRAWRIVCSTYDDEAARRYYDEWVAIAPNLLADALERGIVVRHPHVRSVMRAIGFDESLR